MQAPLPIVWHAPSRSRHGLIERMVIWRSQLRAVYVVAGGEVPEPVFARFVAASHRMPGIGGVPVGVLRRRRITTTDMAANGATSQMEPPATRGQALDAAWPARGYRSVDLVLARHPLVATGYTVITVCSCSRLDHRRDGGQSAP